MSNPITYQPHQFGNLGTSNSVQSAINFSFQQPGQVDYQAGEVRNKRSFSPSEEYESRRSDSEEAPNSQQNGNVTTRFPTALRVKGVKKRYRKEMVSQKTLTYLLDALSRNEILEIVEKVTENNPQLRSDFLALVPRPTLQSVAYAFSNLEQRVVEAFPYSRDGNNRDRYSFTRVRPRLIELKESMIQYADHFFTAEKEMPSMIFSFLKLATDLIHSLPEWDNEGDNYFKKQCYSKLAEYWNEAIELAALKMEEGKLFGKTLVTEWATDLNRHNHISNGLFVQSIYLFQEKLGWVIGIGPVPNTPNLLSFPNC